VALSGIQSGQNVYNNLLASQGAKAQGPQTNDKTLKPDTVEISYEARARAEAAEVLKDIPPGTYSEETGIPDVVREGLRMFSIPGWMGEFTPRHSEADKILGQPYSESNSALRDALSPSEKEDLSEYMHTLHQHYTDELRSRNLTNIEFNKIRFHEDASLSEEVHQAVRQRLAADPRALELMQEFGVTFKAEG